MHLLLQNLSPQHSLFASACKHRYPYVTFYASAPELRRSGSATSLPEQSAGRIWLSNDCSSIRRLPVLILKGRPKINVFILRYNHIGLRLMKPQWGFLSHYARLFNGKDAFLKDSTSASWQKETLVCIASHWTYFQIDLFFHLRSLRPLWLGVSLYVLHTYMYAVVVVDLHLQSSASSVTCTCILKRLTLYW